MSEKTLYVPWPSRQKYVRFFTVSAGDAPPTFDEYATMTFDKLQAAADAGYRTGKVAVDPDEMARWCRGHSKPITAKARESYAAHLVQIGVASFR